MDALTQQQMMELRMELATELAELVRTRLSEHDADAAALHREVTQVVISAVGDLLTRVLADPIARLDQRIRELEDRQRW